MALNWIDTWVIQDSNIEEEVHACEQQKFIFVRLDFCQDTYKVAIKLLKNKWKSDFILFIFMILSLLL